MGTWLTSGKVKGGERRGLGPTFHMLCPRHNGALTPHCPEATRLRAPLTCPQYVFMENWRNLSLLIIKYPAYLRCQKKNQQNGMCTQRRLRSAWASAQSDQSSLSAWRKLGSLVPIERKAKTLIRLCRCPGWSESLLGTQSFCLSWGSSFICLSGTFSMGSLFLRYFHEFMQI